MRHARPAVTGRESTFRVSDLFFSRTDAKGRILSCNEVFVRVSGYAREELIGEPHNMVRHPWMPRSVFALVWDRLAAGLQISAYTVNLAADGSYYWVLASIRPVTGGYLSIRQKPCHPELFAAVQAIYTDVLNAERAAEAAGAAGPEIIAAGTAQLGELLTGAGFAGYEAFMGQLLPAEVAARTEVMEAAQEQFHASGRPDRRGAALQAAELGQEYARVSDSLLALVQRIDMFESHGAQLADQSAYVRDLARKIYLFSLQTALLGHQLGERAAGVSAVAGLVKDGVGGILAAAELLTNIIDRIRTTLGALAYSVAASKLEADALRTFVTELIRDQAPDPILIDDLGLLAEGISDDVRTTSRLLGELRDLMPQLRTPLGQLDALLREMGTLTFNGRVECSRIDDGADAVKLFAQIRGLVREAAKRLSGVDNFSEMIAAAAREGQTIDTTVHALVRRIADTRRSA
ncbi:PAS domain-containing protein [Paractinoplanes durhamensis]|uniref:Methyl-accepting chemotaxis protein n=1 Tax=Paractinoplanes durhamensis TaxID=113563 RepID=A0ABQ3YXZ0_9ACTN|nr:PAS domain-containing protein [Actinoplanes durhamensis]GIE02421.1 methyl-accepting chemotaxis protein [Actinoplanes durhamensis]